MVASTWRSGAAMADGLGDLPTHWLAPIGTAIGAAGLWLANKAIGKAAVQTALNSGFSSILAEYRQTNAALVLQLRTERAEHEAERDELKGEIRGLQQSLDSLQNYLRKHDIQVPNPTPVGRRLAPPDDPV